MPIHHDTSFVDSLKPNVAVLFLDRVAKSPSSEAFRYPKGEAWESVTWKEAGDRVEALAAGLLSLGIESEQRVGIVSGTRYEWILADLAVMCAGRRDHHGLPVHQRRGHGVHPQRLRVPRGLRRGRRPDRQGPWPRQSSRSVAKVVTFDGQPTATGSSASTTSPSSATPTSPSTPTSSRRPPSIAPDQLATLIYTSGTTGPPQGRAAAPPVVGLRGRGHRGPGHPRRERPAVPVAADGALVRQGPAVHPARVRLRVRVDGRVEKIVDNLAVVKPTFMGAAPRIFEKAHGRIVTMQAAEGGAKEKIFNKAFEVGLKVDRLKREGKSVPLPLKLQHGLFDKLVFSKVRDRFGGRVRFFISGAAALNREIAEWFNAAGIVILEGYGMTGERRRRHRQPPRRLPDRHRRPALPGSEVKHRRGRRGPDQGPARHGGLPQPPEETAKALTADGWLHTGDKGCLDADGYLTITGRIKELFKTSGGKYIAPPAIESKFKAICPYASQFMVFGDERNYVRRADHPRPRRDGRLGRGERLEAASTPRSSAPTRCARWSPGTSTSSTPPEPLGDHQEVGGCSTTT